MAVSRLDLHDFTVFRRAQFDFSPGLNILIGENGTGKSHLLKVLYAVEAAVWDQQPAGRQAPEIKFAPLEAHLLGAYRVPTVSDLVHRAAPTRQAAVRVQWTHGGWLSFTAGVEDISPAWAYDAKAQRPVFLPTREMLSIFPGFEETVRNRELEFDETYAHLAEALNLPPLKGERLKRAAPLLAEIEATLGGAEEQREGRFFVTLDRQSFEAHLVAEGLRKVATLARLIRNGRIGPDIVLFWDEPEANLNPVLMRKVVRVLLALAAARVQIFLASHDYLLTQTLSLAAEHPGPSAPPMRFFGLTRTTDGSVNVEQSDTIAGIAHNPILQEHARQYDLEADAFLRSDDPPKVSKKRARK